MRKINLKDIYLSYFLSTGEKVEHKFLDGITFINGDNKSEGQEEQKNGCGKTAIFLDGVMFGLYGVISRSIVKSKIPYNRGTKKTCIVRITLEVIHNGKTQLVKITRQLQPNKLKLEIDGEEFNQATDPTQEHIVQEILGGVRPEVFQQAIAMKINNTTPFMSMKKVERDKFLGGIFDMEYIKLCLKLAREDYNDTSKKVGGKQGEVSTKKPQIDQIKSQIEVTKTEMKNRISEKNVELKSIEKQIEEFEIPPEIEKLDMSVEQGKIDQQRATIQEKEDALVEKRTKLRNLHSTKTQTQNQKRDEIKSLNRDITKKENQIDSNKKSKSCPTCKRDFDEDCKHELDEANKELEDEIGDIKVSQKKLEDEIQSIEDELPKLVEVGTKINEKIETLNTARSAVSKKERGLSDKILKNQKEINARQSVMDSFDRLGDTKKGVEAEIVKLGKSDILDKLKKDQSVCKSELKELESELKDLEEELEILDHAKIIFGDKGLRSLILGRLIGIFNQNLAQYLDKLKAPFNIEFDKDFDYVLTTKQGIEQSFESLSGGEQLRVTTALAFTFKDILRIQNQVSFNLSIYDEWFDSSVDSQGIKYLGEILVDRHKEFGESAYIISHRQDLDIENSNNITVVKENHQSYLVE